MAQPVGAACTKSNDFLVRRIVPMSVKRWLIHRAVILIALPVLGACTDNTSPPTAVAVSVVGGNNQITAVTVAPANPLVVQVTDQHSEPMPGAEVTWTIEAGSGS